MNILFFCRRFWPEIGGVEKHVLEVSKSLVRRGNKVTVVTEIDNRKAKGKRQKAKIFGISIFKIPITASEKLKKFQIWRWLWENRQLIDEADIIHCHDVFYWFLPFKLLYPRKKVFTTFHGYEGACPPKKTHIWSHQLAKHLSKGAIAIGDWHEKWYGVKPDCVSYGAAEAKESFGPPAAAGPLRMTQNFCFVGRLAPDTGIMTYLAALKILSEKGKKYSLVVCGDGPQRADAEKYAENNRLRVTFMGFVRNVEKYISEADFVFVSRYLGIIETLLKQKPVFAVYDTLMKEDYLRLAPFAKVISIAKDPLELSRQIRYFEKDGQEKQRQIREGFEWARTQTWKRVAGEYLNLWGKYGG